MKGQKPPPEVAPNVLQKGTDPANTDYKTIFGGYQIPLSAIRNYRVPFHLVPITTNFYSAKTDFLYNTGTAISKFYKRAEWSEI